MSAVVEIVEASTPTQLEAVRSLFLSYRKGLWQECQMPES
jgi:hypothetical protein